VGVAPRQNIQALLEFLRADKWFPIASDRFGRNLVVFADDPTRVCPVVEDVRQAADVRLAFAMVR
jgi:hypothetical protein